MTLHSPLRRPASGFTLLELLIALAIAALLAAVAYPSYASHTRRTYRAAASACLQALAHQMERRYTTSFAYDSTTDLPGVACSKELAASYDFGFAASEPTATTYRLEARPKNQQANDTDCGTLRLDQTGQREVSGKGGVQSCWR